MYSVELLQRQQPARLSSQLIRNSWYLGVSNCAVDVILNKLPSSMPVPSGQVQIPRKYLRSPVTKHFYYQGGSSNAIQMTSPHSPETKAEYREGSFELSESLRQTGL